jgi:hypothetical protein
MLFYGCTNIGMHADIYVVFDIMGGQAMCVVEWNEKSLTIVFSLSLENR